MMAAYGLAKLFSWERIALCAVLLLTVPAFGQSAPSNVLPVPDPPFKGHIDADYKNSTPDYPRPVTAPKDAPNVLIILLDDVGFGMTGTFGGPVPTPALDELANNGLKYNRFHTTALCSPSRAALLTGRNHHSVGNGVIIEMGTGYPGYTGILPKSAATIAQILQGNGYATAAFGKWHNTPENEIGPSGPFDRWPTGLGFGTFYGFNQGETNQYRPVLYRNTTPVDQPKKPEEGYHFTTDITNEAISWIQNASSASNRPWFCYFAPGAVHAPHHAPKEWREKFKGQFEFGWDRLRKLTFARQRQSKIIPMESVLTLRPPEIPAWEDLSVESRQIASRLMENYAGFMAHTDFEVGRLVQSLRESEQIDNTLIFYIVGDNGASAEGGPEGTFNEVAALSGYNPGAAGVGDRIEQIGDPGSEPHIPVGWAWAMNTPFKWAKQVASHFGGTRNPMVVHWPKGITVKGQMRSQFHHLVDIAPTILEVTGVQAPTVVDGIQQRPIEGISMAYSFNDGTAKDQKKTQYFEMLGNRGVYHDGWFACTRHGTPWITTGNLKRFELDQWELYDLKSDFTQISDIAARNPVKLKELQKVFQEEAVKYQVLPLDDRLSQRLDPRLRTSGPIRTNWVYYGNSIRLPEPLGPIVAASPHTAKLNITIPAEGAQGVIACAGGDAGGWSVYVNDDRLCYTYNFFGYEKFDFQSSSPLPKGAPVEITMEYSPNEVDPATGFAQGGTMKFSVDGQSQGEITVGKSAHRHGVEPFEVGRDSISPVSSIYADRGDFPFTGTIQRVEFNARPTP